MTGLQLWAVTLAAGALIAIVVGALLAVILRMARRIAGTLDEIWTAGQSVANNTLHIDLLRRSAVTAENMLASLDLSSQYARRVQSRKR